MPNISRRTHATIPLVLLVAACAALAACAQSGSGTTSGAAADPITPAGGWSVQASGSRASLRGISAVNERVAWASGSGSTILRTIDGGLTWQRYRIPGADSLDFRGVQAIDELRAFVMSSGDGAARQARIYATHDGGENWRLALSDTTKGVFFDAIAFWDEDRGIVLSDPVNGKFVAFSTDDGGATWWKPMTMPAAREGEAAFAAGGAALTIAVPGHAWFVTGGTSGSRVFHSTDRGRTWTVAEAPVAARGASAGLFAVGFRNPSIGVAVGGDYNLARQGSDHVVRTADGGATWTLAPSSPDAAGYWSGLSYVVDGRAAAVVAVGLAGTMLSRDDGATWTRIDTTAYNAVSFASPRAGWAVGSGGRIARWRGTVKR
jgi:photosystem II stability/assembly factor-like uncharacterized protein